MKFLGYGSAFNINLGNTSAFIKEGNSLLLIDCGCTVFSKVINENLLENIKNLNIIITHTHPDHAGSLGDIIFYSYYIMKIKANIYFPNQEHIEKYFSSIGVTNEMCNIICNHNVTIVGDGSEKFEVDFIKAIHVENLPSYSFTLKSAKESFYYSGDTRELSKNIVDKLINGEIQKLYHEVSSLDIQGFSHMYIGRLANIIPTEYRERVYCMHLDENLTKEVINSYGFNIVN